MKYISVLLFLLLFFCCKKKKTEEEPPVTTTTTGSSTTTTGGQPIKAKYAAEFTAYNSLAFLNTANGDVKIYNKNGDVVYLQSVKLNNKQMPQIPFGEGYRSTFLDTIFTTPVTWELSDNYNDFPDTSFTSKNFPLLGFQTDVTKVYDKTKDFTITVDVSTCDSMLFELGEVTKRIPGRTGITSIIFKPTDGVKRSTFDTTEVNLSVETYNYDIFTVWGRKWKCMTGTTVSSHYRYK